MKSFWILFTLFLLTLSVYPCSDSEECKTKSVIEVFENNNHEKHHHDNEECPPFCACTCCGLNVFQLQNIEYSFNKKLIFNILNKKINFYSFIYNKKIASKIWQPPKNT